jgi:hypothetical protein
MEQNDLIRTDYFLTQHRNLPARDFPNCRSVLEPVDILRQVLNLSGTPREHEIDIFLQERSRDSYPPPKRTPSLLNRALCHDHDQVIGHDWATRRLRGKGHVAFLVTSSTLATSSAF